MNHDSRIKSNKLNLYLLIKKHGKMLFLIYKYKCRGRGSWWGYPHKFNYRANSKDPPLIKLLRVNGLFPPKLTPFRLLDWYASRLSHGWTLGHGSCSLEGSVCRAFRASKLDEVKSRLESPPAPTSSLAPSLCILYSTRGHSWNRVVEISSAAHLVSHRL